MSNGYKPLSEKWSLCRFLRTLTYFGVIPFLGNVTWVQSLLGNGEVEVAFVSSPGLKDVQNRVQGMRIFDFSQVNIQSDAGLSSVWGAVDDVVMGGVSASRLQAATEQAVFTGTVSILNSGGFASVRTRNFEPPFDLSAHHGIRLNVRGDGNRYKFLLRDSIQWDGIAYSYSFDTVADQWMLVDIPFDAMVPVFRARTMSDAPALDAGSVRAFQFMLSKFEYDGSLNPAFEPGSFELFIKSVDAY